MSVKTIYFLFVYVVCKDQIKTLRHNHLTGFCCCACGGGLYWSLLVPPVVLAYFAFFGWLSLLSKASSYCSVQFKIHPIQRHNQQHGTNLNWRENICDFVYIL